MQTLCWSKTRPSFSGAHNSYISWSTNTIFVPRIGMYIRIKRFSFMLRLGASYFVTGPFCFTHLLNLYICKPNLKSFKVLFIFLVVSSDLSNIHQVTLILHYLYRTLQNSWNSIMVVQKQKCKNIHIFLLLCCGSDGQYITIATHFERKYGRQFSNVLYIHPFYKYQWSNLEYKTTPLFIFIVLKTANCTYIPTHIAIQITRQGTGYVIAIQILNICIFSLFIYIAGWICFSQ